MFKKFRLVYLLMLFFCFLFSIQVFAQVKKPVAKKPVIAAKKNTVANKAQLAAKTNTITITSKIKTDPVRVKIITGFGEIIVRLSDSTPLHRDNFVKLVKEGFYDSLLFHRIIPNFMIQGGDPSSKYAPAGELVGNGGGDMARIPAEFHPSLYHKKGALAAARDGNPQMASSACQFYLVQGTIFNDAQLNMLEQQRGSKFSPEQRSVYTTVGGTPQLDMAYTVFGEVESGLEVITQIIHLQRDDNNRPLGDVRMKMELMK